MFWFILLLQYDHFYLIYLYNFFISVWLNIKIRTKSWEYFLWLVMPQKFEQWLLASILFLGEFTSSYLGKAVNTHLWVPVWLTGVQKISSYLSDRICKGIAEQNIAQELPSVKKNFCILPVGFQARVATMQMFLLPPFCIPHMTVVCLFHLRNAAKE